MNAAASHARFAERFGPWALVTGASDGIGRDFARQLAARGLNLVVVARRLALLDQLAAELTSAHGVRVRALPLDLSEPGAGLRLVEQCRPVDIGLVVAAAGFGTSGPLLANRLDDELNMLDLNCRAVLELAHGFGARLAQRGRGGMVLMSSLLAFQGVPRAANYAATKAYVQALAEGLQREWAPRGIDVLACAPGPVDTGFAARARMRMGMAASVDGLTAGVLDALARRRRVVRPGLLAKALEASLATLPRPGRSWVLAKVMQGMMRDQAATRGG
jgi:short-subunit dehydrogenase